MEEKHVLYEQIDTQGASMCDVAGVLCVEALLVEDYPVLETYAELLAAEKNGISFVRIERANGQVLAEASTTAYKKENPESVRMYTSPITISPASTDVLGRVAVGMSTRQADAIVTTRITSMLINALLSFVLVTILLALVLHFFVTRPLAVLDSQAQRLAEGELDIPVELSNGDEIGRLAQTLESMRQNLNESYNEIHQQNEQLKVLDRMKDEFLANMTHELRTPMNSIMGFSDILCEEEMGPEQKKYAYVIHEASQNLLEIINDILDFSKIAQGKFKIDILAFSLDELLANVKMLFASSAMDKGLEFTIRPMDCLPTQIQTDPVRLKQCLVNLVGNAIKFTDAGYVHLDITSVQVNGRSHLRFDVKDTGIGIAPEKQSAIFESFTQADGSHTRRYGGTGLGLTITKRLAYLLGGSLVVESEPGAGSVFTLTVPVDLSLQEVELIAESSQSVWMNASAC